MTIKQLYLAGPYTGATSEIVCANVFHAIQVAHRVVQCGYYPVTSHAIGAHMWDGAGQDADWWYEATLEQMRRCDGVLMLPDWTASTGACHEHDEALNLGLPVFYSLAEAKALWG